MIRLRAALALCALALAPGEASAQEREAPDLEAEHQRGLDARVAHRDVEARDIFRALYERTREPRALARMALAEGATGAWVAAEEHLLAALDERDDPWIRANRAALEENLTLFQRHLASLDVVADAPGAELWVDDLRVARLPLARALRVAAGEVHFEVRAAGRAPARWRQRVEAGAEPLRVVIELAEAPPAPSAAAAPPPAPRAPPVAPPPAPIAPAAASRAWTRPAGIAAVAVGATGVVAGAVLVGLSRRNEGTFDAMGCREVARGVSPPCDGLESDTSGALEPAALAAFVAGGALSVAGVALWLAAPRAASPRATLPCAPAGLGLACTVVF